MKVELTECEDGGWMLYEQSGFDREAVPPDPILEVDDKTGTRWVRVLREFDEVMGEIATQVKALEKEA